MESREKKKQAGGNRKKKNAVCQLRNGVPVDPQLITFFLLHIRDGPLEKLWGGGRGIFVQQEFFFRYQIPCMNLF